MNKLKTDVPFTGMGYWTRANSEPCLLFTKGSPKRKSKSVKQIVLDWIGGMFDTETIATPIQAHSQKPDAVYSRVEALVDGPYCELFARRPYAGWDCWGNEVKSDVELKSVVNG
jgi:N6-adenosine-specific RNA methylase IME4